VPLAMKLGKGFVPVRKPGKLPWKTNRIEYVLEYGTDAVEIHQDAVLPGERVLLVDDLLATGGTMGAACQLVEACGGKVAGMRLRRRAVFPAGAPETGRTPGRVADPACGSSSSAICGNLSTSNPLPDGTWGNRSRFSRDSAQSLDRSSRSWHHRLPARVIDLWCLGSHQDASRKGKPDESRGRKAIGPSAGFPPAMAAWFPK
jgi:hypothetical protein